MRDITPIPDRAAYIKSIRPAVTGRSDKYSWLFYRHLAKLSGLELPRVLAHRLDLADLQTFVPFDTDTAQPAHLFIGRLDDGFGVGAYLSDIICGLTAKGVGLGAHVPRLFIHATDVSEWFWPEYARVGRCVWDREHDGFMADTAGRYSHEEGADAKFCNWCGQRLVIETWTETVQHSRWVPEGKGRAAA